MYLYFFGDALTRGRFTSEEQEVNKHHQKRELAGSRSQVNSLIDSSNSLLLIALTKVHTLYPNHDYLKSFFAVLTDLNLLL